MPLPTEEVPTETSATAPTATPEPTPTPPPLVIYDGWKLDCPGCSVILLDTMKPEVVGAADLQPGDAVRVAGCTRAQTTVAHRYIFEAADGNYSGVAVFDPGDYPRTERNLECFEMLGEYKGTDLYAISVQYVDGRWEYELVKGEAAQAATGPEWEPAGVLMEFAVTEWASISEDDYASVVKARTDPAYASRFNPLLPNTPTPTTAPALTPAPAPTEIPTLTATTPPTPTATPRPTPTSRPTSTPRPRAISIPTPVLLPTLAPIPTIRAIPPVAATPKPTSARAETLTEARDLMLEIINQARADAGVPPLVLDNNRAAQIHANNALAGCFSSHWGLDGTKPYMRYSLAGGYQSNAENVSGLDVCIRAGQGYAAIRSVEYEVRQAMDGFLGSPGHRRAITDPAYRKVNLGIAWDRYNFRVVQLFQGNYVEFEELPALENGVLSFKGTLRNGAALVPDNINKDLGVQVYYDPPLQAFTRGQLTRVYSSSPGDLVASIRPEAKDGWHYSSDNFTMCLNDYPEPQDFPPDTPAPRTPEESHTMHSRAKAGISLCKNATIPWLDASRWKLRTDSFDVRVGLRSILQQHGPGVYTVVLWANLDGEKEVVSEYSIFHETKPPSGYGSR
ncbi:MAG: CAP domain-containing protein [Chloroflexi bacterium]|nr:CAP domain-containing protein [Chloroflexota bacterium]